MWDRIIGYWDVVEGFIDKLKDAAKGILRGALWWDYFAEDVVEDI